MDEVMNGVPPAASAIALFQHPQYLVRRKMLQLLGGRVDIYAPDGSTVGCCLQKAFKLKEDITLFTDESKAQPLLHIKARHIIDFSAAYDVRDAISGQHIGVLRRRGFASMIRDAWEILDTREQMIAQVEEDNLLLALVRRLLTNLIPQSYHFTTTTGAEVATAHQHFNPFIHKMDLVMPSGPYAGLIDPRLVMACTLLLVLIEGRQE